MPPDQPRSILPGASYRQYRTPLDLTSRRASSHRLDSSTWPQMSRVPSFPWQLCRPWGSGPVLPKARGSWHPESSDEPHRRPVFGCHAPDGPAGLHSAKAWPAGPNQSLPPSLDDKDQAPQEPRGHPTALGALANTLCPPRARAVPGGCHPRSRGNPFGSTVFHATPGSSSALAVARFQPGDSANDDGRASPGLTIKFNYKDHQISLTGTKGLP